MSEMKKPLGPGYRAGKIVLSYVLGAWKFSLKGWYGFEPLADRVDDCVLERVQFAIDPNFPNPPPSMDEFVHEDLQVQEMLNDPQATSLEDFAFLVSGKYHMMGHLMLGDYCVRSGPQGPEGRSGMTFDAVSARDPIFYRWHGHLENLMQQFRDRKFPEYTLQDFGLDDGIRVNSVDTIIDKQASMTNEDLKNILITYTEEAWVNYAFDSQIHYYRTNHLGEYF